MANNKDDEYNGPLKARGGMSPLDALRYGQNDAGYAKWQAAQKAKMAGAKQKAAKPAVASSPAPNLFDNPVKHDKKWSDYQATQRGVPFGPTAAERDNPLTDTIRNLNNYIGDWGRFTEQKIPGGGYGDFIFGRDPRQEVGPQKTQDKGDIWGILSGYGDLAKGFKKPEDLGKTFAMYLQEALGLMGGAQRINYDPERDTLRRNAGENDARLEAMYRQLRGSIDADAAGLSSAYQGARDATRDSTDNAIRQAQASTDSANARNDQVLANLGIEEARAAQIVNGTDLSSQTAHQIADQASRGAASEQRLASNEATALAHNTNIGNAAGLEGALQRAGNQSKLMSLLANIDMQEQRENAGFQQNQFAQNVDLANNLVSFDRYNQERKDQLQMAAQEMASKNQPKPLPDLGTMLQALGQDASWLTDDPQSAARLLDVMRKLNIVP